MQERMVGMGTAMVPQVKICVDADEKTSKVESVGVLNSSFKFFVFHVQWSVLC